MIEKTPDREKVKDAIVKKPYHPPSLKNHGTVQETVKTTSFGGASDGPSTYT